MRLEIFFLSISGATRQMFLPTFLNFEKIYSQMNLLHIAWNLINKNILLQLWNCKQNIISMTQFIIIKQKSIFYYLDTLLGLMHKFYNINRWKVFQVFRDLPHTSFIVLVLVSVGLLVILSFFYPLQNSVFFFFRDLK